MSESSVGEKTNKQLEDEIKELKDMITKLVASKQPVERKPKVPKESVEKVEKKEQLSPNTYIKTMSLVNNVLNLSTKPHGRGKTFRFENFGDIKSLFYSELLEVIENHPNFFRAGYFYILDSRVIEENNYHELYQKILSKTQMEEIFKNSANALALFTGANEKQQSVIIDDFVDKIVAGLPVDMNLVSNISKIAKIDIMKRVEDSRQQETAKK